MKGFDEQRLQRSGAVVEGQGRSAGDTRQATVAEVQPDPSFPQLTKEPEVQFPCLEGRLVLTVTKIVCKMKVAHWRVFFNLNMGYFVRS